MLPALRHRCFTFLSRTLTIAIVLAPFDASAAEYFVNNASPTCSNTGPGTMEVPYCSITAALAARHSPGTVITVLPGTYREQISVGFSGTSGNPITLRAQPGASPVIVDGTDDFSSPSLWTQLSGEVWQAPSVTWAPRQVFADGARLAPSTANPADLPPRSFRHLAGLGLYVNAGGGDPASHATQVGRRLYGFFASSKSWLVIQGFTVIRAEDRCIQVQNSSNVQVLGNRAHSSGRYGIQAQGDSAVTIAGNVSSDHQGHGIALTAFTAASIVEDNESFGNSDPLTRVACGLYLFSAPRNLIRRNRWHHNQDSGSQFTSGSNDNLSISNMSWSNGDHGFDHIGATGSVHANEVAFANHIDGYSVEATSTGTVLHNLISIDNGPTTGGHNLFVDTLSTAGFQADDNLYWNADGRPPVRFAHSVYASVAAFAAARGRDTRSLQADPRFVDAAGGDFHLLQGSPAIDNANGGAPGWPDTDVEGFGPSDDPGIPDQGMGPLPFGDRGPFEFRGASGLPNAAPEAQVALTPSSGSALLAVRVNAAGSSDPEGQPLSYRFDMGDGTRVGPQGWPFVDHLYPAGQWAVTVIVTDAAGVSDTTTAIVVVADPPGNLVEDASFETGVAGWTGVGGAALARSPGGHTGGYSLLATAPAPRLPAFGIQDAPEWVKVTAGIGSRYVARAWVRAEVGGGSARLRVRELLGPVAGAWRSSPPVGLGGTWSPLELEITTEFSASRLDVEVVAGSNNAGDAFRVDDVSVEHVAGTGTPREEPRPDRPRDGDGFEFSAVLQPNPMGGDGARLRLRLSRPGEVHVGIFDLAGRLVRNLAHGIRDPGEHILRFDGRSETGARLRGGIYHYRVVSPQGVRHGRFVILD